MKRKTREAMAVGRWILCFICFLPRRLVEIKQRLFDECHIVTLTTATMTATMIKTMTTKYIQTATESCHVDKSRMSNCHYDNRNDNDSNDDCKKDNQKHPLEPKR